MHGELTGQLNKFVLYEMLVPPGFVYVPDIFDSGCTKYKFVQVAHVPATGRLVGW